MPDSQCRLESGEVLDPLSSLVQKSLVVYEEDEQGQGRITRCAGTRLLEPTRQYSRDRLVEAGEVQATRDRHAAFSLGGAEQAEPELRGNERGRYSPPAWR